MCLSSAVAEVVAITLAAVDLAVVWIQQQLVQYLARYQLLLAQAEQVQIRVGQRHLPDHYLHSELFR
jgi:hypothetical protein